MRVAIIGGGICGLYLAWKLSEKGHNVTLFEKKERIGQEVCSGLFSERILKFIPESQKLIQNKISSVLLHFPKKTIVVKFSKKFFVMSHFELDKLVAGLAQKSGAKLFLNHNINEMPKGFDKIIGCDGANSFVRRSLGLPELKYRLGILGLTENCSRLAGQEQFSVQVWPSKTGFSWKIPKGDKIEYGGIGLSFENRKSRIIPQGLIIPKDSSITLCGDAAGLTKPWSGGGVVWGLTAANILLETFPDFKKYRKLVKRFFLPKIIFSKIAVKLVYFLGFKMPWLLPSKILMESDFLI